MLVYIHPPFEAIAVAPFLDLAHLVAVRGVGSADGVGAYCVGGYPGAVGALTLTPCFCLWRLALLLTSRWREGLCSVKILPSRVVRSVRGLRGADHGCTDRAHCYPGAKRGGWMTVPSAMPSGASTDHSAAAEASSREPVDE